MLLTSTWGMLEGKWGVRGGEREKEREGRRGRGRAEESRGLASPPVWGP